MKSVVSLRGPTVRFIPAQGNALGMSDHNSHEPCKGDPIDRPYRAFIHAPHLPGRCPGLGWFGPLALSTRSLAPCILACVLMVTVTELTMAGEDQLPKAPTVQREFHGVLGSDRFWARLTTPKEEFAKQRVLQLVYAPPKPDQIGGAHLIDCPYLLVDDRLRLVAWNGRDSLSRVIANARGYVISREEEQKTADGKELTPSSRDISIQGPRGWDERLAPILLALAWRANSTGSVPCYDLFAPVPIQSAVAWENTHVTIAGRKYEAQADSLGRLARLLDSTAAPVLTITAWTEPPPP